MRKVWCIVLTMKEVSEFNSLKNETVLCGEEGLTNLVTGAMVMEAIDIEDWGRPGQVLLTSNYAFEKLSDEEIDSFFSKANQIGIAGIIFKKNRLVNEIPEFFISNCKKYQLPLIEVHKNITYEVIINEILKSLINRNALLLQSYYDNHQKFIQLMMNQAGVSKILETLNSLINVPVSLIEKVEGDIIGTDESYHDYQIDNKMKADQKEQMDLEYEQYCVNYTNHDTLNNSKLLVFPIPNLGYEEHELLIHGVERPMSDMDFMAVTNTIIAIQTELVKRYALRQNNKSRLNEMVADLVHGRLTNPDDIEETIHNLRMDPKKMYRVVVFHFNNQNKDLSASTVNRFTEALVNHFENKFGALIYITRKQKVSLIVSTEKLTMNEIKKRIELILEQLKANKFYKYFYSHITISNEVSLYNLSEGHRQAMDTQKIMDLWDNASSIVSYQDLGLYQLFVETENLDSLERFIPETINELHRINPELLNTLYVFINVNQNYSEASEMLFVHPKTVRYRINNLKDNYNIDFHDPEEMLRYSIAIRILKILQKRRPDETKE